MSLCTTPAFELPLRGLGERNVGVDASVPESPGSEPMAVLIVATSHLKTPAYRAVARASRLIAASEGDCVRKITSTGSTAPPGMDSHTSCAEEVVRRSAGEARFPERMRRRWQSAVERSAAHTPRSDAIRSNRSASDGTQPSAPCGVSDSMKERLPSKSIAVRMFHSSCRDACGTPMSSRQEVTSAKPRCSRSPVAAMLSFWPIRYAILSGWPSGRAAAASAESSSGGACIT
eukprot:scaffold1112_cov116-Isochrysis_galbana.AAC.30